MAIIGAHVLLYSSRPDELRSVLTDVFSWTSVDAGGGWLIYAMPQSEIAVHPAEHAAHELTLMCDDLSSTVADLESRGVVFDEETSDEGWGLVRTMVLPGDVRVLLYEPRHASPLDLK